MQSPYATPFAGDHLVGVVEDVHLSDLSGSEERMDDTRREWVSLREAADIVGIPMTTIQ